MVAYEVVIVADDQQRLMNIALWQPLAYDDDDDDDDILRLVQILVGRIWRSIHRTNTETGNSILECDDAATKNP